MSSSHRRGITNAADPRQVRAAGRLEQRREQRWTDALVATLETVQGRAFIWALIIRTGVYETPFSTHGGMQSFNIGRGDVGRMIMAECLRLAPTLYLKMEAEARTIDALEDEAVATATAQATTEEIDHG